MSRQRIWLRRVDGQFGFTIATPTGFTDPIDSRNPAYVSRVEENGPAHQDGRLEVGDRVFKVNGISFMGLTHNQAADMIAKSGDAIELEVAKFDFAQRERRNKKSSKPSRDQEQSPQPDTQNQVWPRPPVAPKADVPGAHHVGNGPMNDQDKTYLMLNIIFAFSVLLLYVELFIMKLT